ncbi:AT-rich interactive domain-containing protein 5B-like [Danaus plexippus]|uniref:AT-rich interactive domain-containing protein 5B-like n=1 Tax=Danaus plexippus TaxID=13037 RepID=UPI002AAF7688|nr:AT-rich interactive domain-containing protein 5B-like [Danaus plexippus]
MEKPSYKLVGAPCGHHGQYTFYKAIRLTGPRDRIVAIGDFFFVRIWQDSELVSIGELQLLWTDRVSDQTLVSLRLYFLPENTPDGRNTHGEDEVLAINDKVVLRAEELLSWVCSGAGWRWGLRAVWRGACAPPAEPRHSAPLHHTKLDFSDVEREKSSITVDVDEPGVVVFSYPRYCRYRALVARLEGIQAAWLRDSLVAALGGYAAPTRNTRILYCKDTFEYPELEGHEFVCNHLAPKLKGRPRGRRRRAARSRDRSPDQSPDSRSSDSDAVETRTPRRISLRNGPEKISEDEDSEKDQQFMKQLKEFLKEKNETVKVPHSYKNVSLRSLYSWVWSSGGFAAACRAGAWRERYRENAPALRRIYERYLLQYENHERWNGRKYPKMNGIIDGAKTIDTIDVTDSPARDTPGHTELPAKTLRTPSPRPENLVLDNETGEITKELNITSKPAEELNREFLDSLPKEEKPAKIFVKPVEKLIEPGLQNKMGLDNDGVGSAFFNELAQKLNLGNSDTRFLQQLSAPDSLTSLSSLGDKYTNGHTNSDQKPRSSLRAVRVKTTRAPPTAPTTPNPVPAESSSPPSITSVVNNFGIHHPPTPTANDDDIVEVPYKPKSPEIIDLDEYPESPQAIKNKKLDILKERGLEVTAVPPGPAWPPAPLLLNPVQQIMGQASLFQMYNIIPSYPNGAPAPKVIQASSAFGSCGPEKTVYGNPKDPFMPPPHVLQGTPVKPQRSVAPAPAAPLDVLDLTCKTRPGHKPAVEIVRLPPAPRPQSLASSYSLVDGKAVVGSNLEITLVNKSHTPPRRPQKRSSNGKFVSSKTPPQESPPKKPSPARPEPPVEPYSLFLRGAPGLDPRQLALYRDLVAGQLRYPGLLSTPTTKN